LDEPVEADNSRSYPEGDGLEERTIAVLRERAPCEWEALVAALTDDLEDRLEAALDELQQADHVRYDGRRGGYVAIEDGE
jgi:hypothetical protein